MWWLFTLTTIDTVCVDRRGYFYLLLRPCHGMLLYTAIYWQNKHGLSAPIHLINSHFFLDLFMANSQKIGLTLRRKPALAEQKTEAMRVDCMVQTTGVCFSTKEENLPNSMLSRFEKAVLRLRNGEMKLQGDWIRIKHLYYVWINTRAARSKETYILHAGVTEERLWKSTGSPSGSATEKSSSPCCEFLKFLHQQWPKLRVSQMF